MPGLCDSSHASLFWQYGLCILRMYVHVGFWEYVRWNDFAINFEDDIHIAYRSKCTLAEA